VGVNNGTGNIGSGNGGSLTVNANGTVGITTP
jgi:hypothetical protein